MKLFNTILLLSLALPSAYANSLPTNKNEFCNRLKSPEKIQTMSDDSENLISFKNNGGLLNGGVCWWHSRFQRNLFYLSILKPNDQRPDDDKIKKIIHSIRIGKSIIEISGFSSISEFTETYKSMIQAELDKWQLYDGVVLGGWIDGLKGDTKIDPNILLEKMNTLNTYINVDKKIAYQKLQIKGITSHAWLVVNYKQNETGADLGYIDSNNPRSTMLYQYKKGDDSFYVSGYGHFVPYLEFQKEEERLKLVAKNFCNPALMTIDERDIIQDQDNIDYNADIYNFSNNL
jgi:hypothetical protein